MTTLKENTIRNLQNYVSEKIKERGFDDETLQERLLLLSEEVGELLKACRKTGIGHVKDTEKDYDIGSELVDVLTMLFAVAGELKIDVEKSFLKKEKEIYKRNYSRTN